MPIGEIFLASTGVIGEPLDAQKFDGLFEAMAAAAGPNGLFEAAKAIMTTDTYPKVATVKVDLDGVEVAISGMAKGAGMIAPDMATMLSFVFTDAPIGAEALQGLLAKGVEGSFKRHHGRQRHLHLRYAVALCHRRSGQARRRENQRSRRPAPQNLSRRRSTVCCSILPIRW